MRTEYKPAAFKSTHHESIAFYPIVKFHFSGCKDNFWLNDPQPTRGKALKIAENYIKNMNS